MELDVIRDDIKDDFVSQEESQNLNYKMSGILHISQINFFDYTALKSLPKYALKFSNSDLGDFFLPDGNEDSINKETLNDWDELIFPDISEQFHQSIKTVSIDLKKIKKDELITSDDSGKIFDLKIDLKNTHDWYSCLNQARIFINHLYPGLDSNEASVSEYEILDEKIKNLENVVKKNIISDKTSNQISELFKTDDLHDMTDLSTQNDEMDEDLSIKTSNYTQASELIPSDEDNDKLDIITPDNLIDNDFNQENISIIDEKSFKELPKEVSDFFISVYSMNLFAIIQDFILDEVLNS